MKFTRVQQLIIILSSIHNAKRIILIKYRRSSSGPAASSYGNIPRHTLIINGVQPAKENDVNERKYG